MKNARGLVHTSSVIAVVQARMGSQRLPNKTLLHLHGYPVIEWVYRRLSTASALSRIIFAIPDTQDNDVLASVLDDLGAEYYRGSEADLVARFVGAIEGLAPDAVVRACADNPLICGSEVDRLIRFFTKSNVDYAFNHVPNGSDWPDGIGAEICKTWVVHHIHQNAPSDRREHFFDYLWSNQNLFTIETFPPPSELRRPDLKLDLDTIDDYRFLLGSPVTIDMSAKEIICVVDKVRKLQ